MTLDIIIPGEPVAQGRPRATLIKTRFGGRAIRMYSPKKSEDWKRMARTHMMNVMAMKGYKPITGPVGLKVMAVFARPKSTYRKDVPRHREPHDKRPDGDNVIKAVKDAGTNILYLDDAQVFKEQIVKVVGAQEELPYVRIMIDDGYGTNDLKDFS